MIVYAIRHKPTGKFMPMHMPGSSSGSRGWSHWVPEHQQGNPMPRMWDSHQRAARALTAWLEGVFTYVENHYGEYGCEIEMNLEPTKPLIERKREDMEVVQMFLNEAPIIIK
jgi:hypothetical protein